MRSLDQRYADLIDATKRLGHDPDRDRIRELREELDLLDYQLRTSVPAGERHETLTLASREAETLLTAAAARARTARDVAAAARARELHDAQHPTVLSTYNPLARAMQNYRDRDRGMER